MKLNDKELKSLMIEVYLEEFNSILEEDLENLDEAGEWKVVFRKGKRQRKLICPPGTKADGKRCRKMSSQERMKRRKALRKAMKKMKILMPKILKKRKKAMRKRKSAGL